MTSNKNRHQVFYDPKGRRKKGVRLTWIIIGLTITTLATIFIGRVVSLPAMPQLNLIPVENSLSDRGVNSQLQQASADSTRQKRASRTRASKPLAIGFYVNWDNSSYLSLQRNLTELDVVVPQWVRLQDGDEPVVREIDQKALDLIRSKAPNTPVIPMIHNSNGGNWDVAALVHALESDASRRKLISSLTRLIDENKWQGICVDFEQVPADAQPNLLVFMQELHALFNQRGLLVIEAVPFDDPDWNYRAYADATDYLMLMAYDEHWAGSSPGSVCSQPWFQNKLEARMSELAPEKTILCIGGYGYDWQADGSSTVTTFREAMLAADNSKAKINFDPVELNPYFKYEKDGSQHEVWFLDAVTAYNQMVKARSYGVSGFALWRLGSEDPSLWSVFGRNKMSASPAGLEQLRHGYGIDILGTGEILQILTGPKDGKRSIDIDSDSRLITDDQYQVLPSSYVIQRSGHRPGLVSLTFDDGPHADWTPRILDILKREQIKATFFIIGQNGQADPSLVQRIVDEGHEIGNHTFTHPTLDEINAGLIRLELNATRMLIESLTGRTTKLFRPPYIGSEPSTPEKVEPAWIANELGYITVAAGVDSKDWSLPGAQAIVDKTIAGITNPETKKRGQVVLLHDGGGDRSQTVEALPRLIRDLRSRGYRFATISDLAGLTRNDVMPPVQGEQAIQEIYTTAVASTFYALSYSGWGMRWIFLIGIALGIIRAIFIGLLAIAQWLRSRGPIQTNPDYQPFVSVIVPAYNEEKVIVQTIDSLLVSTYQNLEIIVVDDGSTDRTTEVVSERFRSERRVKIFNIANCGKAEALNFGLRHAKGEVIVGLDADTHFEKETIGMLARRFADPNVGAVAGNVKVGNRNNLITRWQALEYITSQNFDRRAFAALNCITIIPGAVGACRRELLDRCGGWIPDTLAEDQELTLNIRRLGYRIVYEEDAIAWTEAPETVRDLMKQRFRWSFGTLQCMWKHRDALFRPKYGALGFIAMPNVWIFQILFASISPIIDLMLVWSIATAVLERLGCTDGYPMGNLKHVVFYYLLFLGVDLLTSTLAFAMERREQWSLLWWMGLQRFCHRQVIYYVMIKSVLAALNGPRVGWRKLERKASVVATFETDDETTGQVPIAVESQR